MFAIVAAVRRLGPDQPDAQGLRGAGARRRARGQGASPGFQRVEDGVLRLHGVGRARRPRRHFGGVRRRSDSCGRSISPGYGFTAIIVAFLGRLNPLGIVAAGLILGLTYLGGEAAQISLGVSDKVARVFQGMLLFFVLGCDTLIHYRIRISGLAARRNPAAGSRIMGIAESILLTIATAATPLLIAAIGELVVERSGVLNLGVEGMMVMGAVCGFAAAALTGSPWIGILAGILAGAAFSLLFAFLTLSIATNQVATGLSLTLLGLGLSGMIGESFVGSAGIKLPSLYIPGLSDIPLVGRLLFGQDPIFYMSIALTFGVMWFLFRTRTGLTLALDRRQPFVRARAGHSGHPLPLPGGHLRRRLRRPRRRASVAGLHAAMGGEHDGGPRLDRAGAGRLRVVAAAARACRRLSVRCRHDRPAACAGARLRHTVAAAFFAALSGNDRRACSNLAQQAADDDEYAGLARPGVRARQIGWEGTQASKNGQQPQGTINQRGLKTDEENSFRAGRGRRH